MKNRLYLINEDVGASRKVGNFRCLFGELTISPKCVFMDAVHRDSGIVVNHMLRGDQFSQVPIASVSEELGRRLNVLRIARQMKVEDLSREMGVSRPTLQRLLDGENTTTETLLRALSALGIIDNINTLVPDYSASPLTHPKSGTLLSERKRVSSSSQLKPDEAWTWGKSHQS